MNSELMDPAFEKAALTLSARAAFRAATRAAWSGFAVTTLCERMAYASPFPLFVTLLKTFIARQLSELIMWSFRTERKRLWLEL